MYNAKGSYPNCKDGKVMRQKTWLHFYEYNLQFLNASFRLSKE